MSYDHRMNPMYELWSYHDNGFIIDELCYIISSMTFIMTPSYHSMQWFHPSSNGEMWLNLSDELIEALGVQLATSLNKEKVKETFWDGDFSIW